jgi:iron(III) transport system substrate-binding protein
VINLYSARHYDTDEALYSNFTKATGIEINRIEAGDDALLERIRTEGANSVEDVSTYESLADPKNKGKVCTRPGSHPYMLSLVSAMVAHHGEEKTEQWARGVVGNFARPPRGGDTDQIRAVAAGECGIALTNSYYLVRLMRSSKPEDRAVAERVGMVWPDQKSFGTHMNISGGGLMRNAPNRENAVRFLEYLASDAAQAYFATGNNEWPVVKGAAATNPELAALGSFKADPLNAAQLGRNLAAAQRIVDRVGWK